MLTVGSLFSGIGGIDLGLERAGMKVLWQVEIDPWCRAVLAKHWPDVERFEDVRSVGAGSLAPVDLIAGGFPCQDISDAGKRGGITAARSGLWSEFARIIRELRPRYVVVENVAALRLRGLDVVLRDLSESGYDAEWDCIPASAVGAPHLRDRIWIVANATGNAGELQPGQREDLRDESSINGSTRNPHDVAESNGICGGARRPGRPSGVGEGIREQTLADADGIDEPQESEGDVVECGERGERPPERWGEQQPAGIGAGGGALNGDRPAGDASDTDREPTEWLAVTRRECRQWLTEPDVGRVAHGVPARVDRLRGLGNAVVPQVIEAISRRIVEAEAGT